MPDTESHARNTNALGMPDVDRQRLLASSHGEPHRVLGAHPVKGGVVIRAFHPDAMAADCILEAGESLEMDTLGHGLYAVLVDDFSRAGHYRLRFRFADGSTWERGDPYRFLPTLGDVDQHLFNEGTHRRLWEVFGSHYRIVDGENGVSFAVWAPNASAVSIVGEFNGWDGRLLPMRQLGSSGIFELFVPDIEPGMLYKYEIRTREGHARLKTDPYARAMEMPPGSASIVCQSRYAWRDDTWMAKRPTRDWTREPMSIYEMHLGSWMRTDGNRPLSYREVAPKLSTYLKRLGFTHVEFLPLAEHPFTGSWGYQISGYYAPTARYGSPDGLRFLIDHLHREGIGVILDWVPAHFPRDDFALRRFDGTALYEHEDPRLGEHPDWNTLIFNYGRNEVRNFLVANALYWLDEFHVDGLRVDAVASMLYLDYSRKKDEWIPNRYGGRENLDAIAFIREFNEVVRTEAPGCFTVAEESTAWPGVTQPVHDGGLGFTFKWNMGWMHDTLEYFSRDPVPRRHHQDQLTFGMMYEHSERFIMPLSHDEVVHGKGSLIRKMPGDEWQKMANLRLLIACQALRPGKQLLFMGCEFAQDHEWNHDTSLDWNLLDDPARAALLRFFEDLNALYLDSPVLWHSDPDPVGFAWIDCDDHENSVVSWRRRDGDALIVVVANLTPVPRVDYRIGAPADGRWMRVLDSDDTRYGGSGYETRSTVDTESTAWHRYPQSMRLDLPPLGIVVMRPEA
jgi:1,4-alpha-glucan branching enzyme